MLAATFSARFAATLLTKLQEIKKRLQSSKVNNICGRQTRARTDVERGMKSQKKRYEDKKKKNKYRKGKNHKKLRNEARSK